MRFTTLFAGVIGLGLVLSACGQETDDSLDEDSPSPVETTEPAPVFGDEPAGSTGAYGLPLTPEDVGASTTDDTTEVIIWTELGCPSCKTLFDEYGEQLRSLVESGDASVEVRFATFLDSSSPNQYSSRAVALAACAYNTDGPEAYWNVLLALYGQQPERGQAGPEDAELVALAESAGVRASIQECVEAAPFTDWVREGNDSFNAEGLSGTPTVFVDGDQLMDPMDLISAIEE